MKEVFRRVIVPVSTTVLLASAVVVPAQAKISANTVADAPIVINEIDSNKDDWVELFNRTDKEISLKGWKIQDVKNDTDTHKLDGTIKPYGYFVLDPNVNLDKDGEEVRLIDPDGKVVDSFKWTKTEEGPDFYRCPDGIGKLEKAADGYNTEGKSNGKCGKSFFEAKAKTGPGVAHNGQPDAKDYVDAKDGLGKTSQDTKYEFVKPVDTSTPGEKKATVKVTYPGGHEETVEVTITVTAEADKRTPQPKDQTVDLNAGVKPEDSIGNVNELPGDTKFGWKGAEPDTSTPGDTTATVVVTYPDSSTDEVQVKISVKEAEPSTSPESPAPSEPTTSDEAPEPTTTASKPKPAFPHGIRINEVNSQGAPADWVELYNETDQPVDISGWAVVDDKDGRKPIKFPKGTRIQPDDYFVFYTEGKTPDGSKGFGLGKGDSVRVFDENGDLVDEVTWEAETHADPYGRDESDGGDLDFKVLLGTTRGEKNLDPFVAPTSPWQFDEPGNPQAISNLNVSAIVGADFSGIDFDDEGIAWVVNNGTGKLWKIEFDDNGNAQVGGEWQLRYPGKTGTPDAEGVTVGKDGALYVATERDGGNDKVSRPSVLRFELPKSTTGELEATHEWNLSEFTGKIGANSGLEAISYLGEDLYAVGVESDGKVYFVDLANDTPVLKDSYKAPFPGVMALDYDMTSGELRVLCDEKCGGASIVLKDNNGKFAPQGEMQRNPKNMGTSIANEGYGTFTKVGECVDGKKQSTTRFLWTDDGATGGTVLRTATSVNEEDCAVPTTSTEQAKPSEETPTSEPVAPAEPTSEEPTSEEAEPSSEEPTSKEAEPTSEEKSTEEAEPTSEEQTSKEAEPTSEEKSTEEVEPTSEEPTSEEAEPTSEETNPSTPISTTVETQPSEPAVTTSEETPGEETTEPAEETPVEETGEAKPSDEETSGEAKPSDEDETPAEETEGPVTTEAPVTDTEPAEEETPAEESGEDKTSEDETPAEESGEDKPSEEAKPSEEETPAEESGEDKPSEEAEPSEEETPAEESGEDKPSEEAEPSEEETPAEASSEEKPAEEETPAEESGEDKPSEEETPAQDDSAENDEIELTLPTAPALVVDQGELEYVIAADKDAAVKVEGLPAGLTFDEKTNTISGTAAEAGTFEVTVTATKGGQTVTKVLELVVNDAPEAEQTGSSMEPKCVAALAGWGVPLLALIPLGLATQLNIPGMENIQAMGQQIADQFNDAVQQALSNPALAQLNAVLAENGQSIGTAAGALGAIALGIAALSTISAACSDGGSSTGSSNA